MNKIGHDNASYLEQRIVLIFSVLKFIEFLRCLNFFLVLNVLSKLFNFEIFNDFHGFNEKRPL